MKQPESKTIKDMIEAILLSKDDEPETPQRVENLKPAGKKRENKTPKDAGKP